MPALVVTLGTLYVFRGIDYIVGRRQADQRRRHAAGVPADGHRAVLGVPVLPAVRARRGRRRRLLPALYRSGRELYAIGSDPDAARLSGIPVGRRVFAAFVASGALAGLAGVLYAARFGTLDAERRHRPGARTSSPRSWSAGWPSSAAAARSTAPRSARLLLTTIGSALPVLGINPFWQRAAVGALILAAIGAGPGRWPCGSARRLRKEDARG